MTKQAWIIWLLMLCVLVSGCCLNFSSETNSIPIESSHEFDLTTLETSVSLPPEQTETTAPDMSLHMESGAHLLKYEDQNTLNYLEYYLFIPENAQINMPLIVFLHGDGEVGKVDSLENYGMMISAHEIYGDEFPFIALFPCTRVYSWTEGTIPDTLIGLIEETVEYCSIDPTRIVITGHSRGSIGTWHMISTYGDYFAAAVPVSCGAEGWLDYSACASVPVLAFAGTSGNMEIKFRNAMNGIVQNLVEAGGQAELVILEGCTHDDTCEAAYTKETFQWMLEQ